MDPQTINELGEGCSRTSLARIIFFLEKALWCGCSEVEVL